VVNSTARIVVFGAGGRLGRLVVTLALLDGLDVRAVIHHANPLPTNPHLDLARADVHHPRSVTHQLADRDIVIACLGSAGAQRPDIATSGAKTIIEGMRRHGLHRLVSVTGTGAALPGESMSDDHALKRAQMAITAAHLLTDGEQHLATIATSPLNWTVLRVPLMTSPHDPEPQPYQLGQSAPRVSSTVPYATTARALLDLALDDHLWPRTAPFIHQSTGR